MPRLLNHDGSAAQEWLRVSDAEELQQRRLSQAEAKLLLPLDLFLADETARGLWLSSEQDVHLIKPELARLDMVALVFAVFTDGRSFSQARMLRDELDYRGDIRATGAFIQDQAHYLLRCGVTSFEISDEIAMDSFKASLDDFSEHYQAAADKSQPLFRRRA